MVIVDFIGIVTDANRYFFFGIPSFFIVLIFVQIEKFDFEFDNLILRFF